MLTFNFVKYNTCMYYKITNACAYRFRKTKSLRFERGYPHNG